MGINVHTILGINTFAIMPVAVICPPIHSMVVVTSPTGDQAPPALAAITIRPAKYHRIFWSSMIFDTSDTITMVVVKLSSNDERKKVIMVIMASSLLAFLVWILSVITRKPSCASISSTIAIAPIKKNKISAISAKCSRNCSPTKCKES